MHRIFTAALALLSLSAAAVAQTPATTPSAPAQASGPPDAARFTDPVSAFGASMSPSGNFVAYVARTDTSEQVIVVNLATQSISSPSTLNSDQGTFDWVSWKGEDRLIIGVTVHHYVPGHSVTGNRTTHGDGSYDVSRVIAMNRDGSNPVQMFEGNLRSLYYSYGSSQLLDSLPNDPSHILITAFDNLGVGVWRADVATGHVERVADGAYTTMDYLTDSNGTPVMRQDANPDGSGYKIYRRPPSGGAWIFVLEARRAALATLSPDFQLLAPGPQPGRVYVIARPSTADLAGLYLYNTATGDLGEPLQQGVHADVAAPWLARGSREIIATCEFSQRLACAARDPAMERNLHALDSFFHHDADIFLAQTSTDGAKWLLFVDGPTQPGAYFFYDVAQHHIVPLATQYPHLDINALSPTDVVNYAGRDGASLWAYVTARPGVSGPRPMVVFPHGGPEARDEYGYDAYVQFLASRGYVVLQPNFRGGSGFGKAFADAGRNQWGLRMQDDITDAVHHMIETGVADPHRICIVGASYGGYAALAGVALTPDLYKCAISISGVSDLLAVLRVESRSTFLYNYWLHSIGDPGANHDALVAASPRLQAAHITAPVLLIHGDTDDVVSIHQSEYMQDALNQAGHPTRLVRIPDEGHHWDEWSTEHRLTLYRESEAFLAQYLGATH
jgi:dipeptidyl aminopeptidase/acylaminoacyl peptidase